MTRRLLALPILAALVAAPPATAGPSGTPDTFATGLSTPWEIVRMPDGRTLVTEQSGRVRTIAPGATTPSGVAFTDGSVTVRKFLGMALHPNYAVNKFVYLYETYDAAPVECCSRILRLIDNGSTLDLDRVILDGIGSDFRHDGGRIKFGPDGKLYVTTGDIHDKSRPREVTNLNGKILRLEAPGDDTDGQPAAGNPFIDHANDNAKLVYSLGHRHPQGIAWDNQGRLWETEHGPSGEGPPPATGGHDELNLIEPGRDYGWPTVAGSQTLENTVGPVCHSGPTAWAPGGLAFAGDGVLYAPALVGEHLHFFEIAGDSVSNHGKLYQNAYGRLRTAVVDGASLLFTEDVPTNADIKRVAIDKDTALPTGTSDCRPPTPEKKPIVVPQDDTGSGSGTGTPSGGGEASTMPAGGLPLGLPQPTAQRAVLVAAAPLDRLLARVRASLRRRGALSRLVRTGRVTVRAGGLTPGRVVVRVKARRGGRTVLVAKGIARPRSRRAFTLRLRVTERGRSVLRRASVAPLRLEAAYQPASGAPVVRTLSLTARRQR